MQRGHMTTLFFFLPVSSSFSSSLPFHCFISKMERGVRGVSMEFFGVITKKL